MFIALYFVFLEKEKMYRFNRFYLLFSVIFSYTAPFITVTSEHPKPTGKIQTALEATTQVLDLTTRHERFDWISFLLILYGIITVILLVKTIYSILKIQKIKGKEIWYGNQKVVVTEKNMPAFSFWKTIYIGKNYLVNNQIDPRIFIHEKSHIDQKHSIDLLFIEVIKIFTWFNPSLFFYKKAVVTNHEFLADESVLKKKFNIKDYQHLILDEIILSKNYNLVHTFNFNNTKKRFIMMNTKKSKMTNLKKVISIPVLLLAFGLFVQKTYAGNKENLSGTITRVAEKISERKAENPVVKQNKYPAKELSTLKEEKDIPENISVKKDTIRPENKGNIDSQITTVAEYPGGHNQLRNNVAKLFDGSKMNEKNQKTMRVEINYIVDEKGKVTDVTATGNDEVFSTEAVSAFKKANENVVWKPAEKDGEPVRYRMKMPMTMSFQ